ncbi:hypothetical protein B0H14DRAFT_3856018 [Mycena olivaceomarginata]|nr:hypothetical protein B0H14DRAFT_3856018 [Mycena olivaceomarginata]
MKLLTALCAGIPLWALAPVFLFSLPQASSALIVPRGDINASLIPTTCLSACEPVLSIQSKCGTDLKCRCTEANAHSFADCIDCAVGTQPDSLAQSVGQNVLSDYVNECAKLDAPVSSLTLSLVSASPTASSEVRTNDALIDAQRSHTVVSGFVALQFIFLLFGGFAAL